MHNTTAGHRWRLKLITHKCTDCSMMFHKRRTSLIKKKKKNYNNISSVVFLFFSVTAAVNGWALSTLRAHSHVHTFHLSQSISFHKISTPSQSPKFIRLLAAQALSALRGQEPAVFFCSAHFLSYFTIAAHSIKSIYLVVSWCHSDNSCRFFQCVNIYLPTDDPHTAINLHVTAAVKR